MDGTKLKDQLIRAEGYAEGYSKGFRDGYTNAVAYVANELNKSMSGSEPCKADTETPQSESD